ncbi:hypothetical protein HK405_014043 [Cladochytrium tenue]|nr:hypothetical protein HK405_014043 [Cladochytrium tenue]
MSAVFLTTTAAADAWVVPLRAALSRTVPQLQLHYPTSSVNPADVEIAIVANPPAGSLANYPNLRLIASMWAGVDGLLSDPSVPRHVPLVRLVDPELTRSMTEFVLLQALVAHRQIYAYQRLQLRKEWNKRPSGVFQIMTHDRVVGVLGVGVLGTPAVRTLASHGFKVLGWSRTAKESPDSHVEMLHGPDGFKEVLSRSSILVNILPLTPATRHLLNKAAFDLMPKGSTLINVGRGATLVEADVIQALDAGVLETAVLDVFEREPLPADNPLWSHPHVVVTPHVSALTNPLTASSIIAETIRKHIDGEPLLNIVEFERGY